MLHLKLTILLFSQIILFTTGFAKGKKYTPVILDNEIIFASVVATDAPFSADPTGANDSTEAINKAMDRVRQMGGGTCFLPSGIYRIQGNLLIPATVTLMGTWQKPDANKPISGTVLIAYTGRGETEQGTPLISIEGPKQGHLKRVTIYYPEQRPDDIVSYPYTIEGKVSHIREITLINSYLGIRMIDNSGSIVSDIYGTVVKTGICTRNSVEFCRIYNIEFDPKYWIGAEKQHHGNNVSKASKKNLDQFLLNNMTALLIGKSDGIGIYNVDAQPCMAALEASMTAEEESRMLIESQNYGLGGVVWKVPGIRKRSGYDAWYFGAHYADLDTISEIPNDLFPFQNQRHSKKLEEHSIVTVTESPYNAIGDGKADDSNAIQRALFKAASNGGGTVYLPQGSYRVTKPLQIPDGVELRGPLAVGQIRVWFEPCTIWIDWLPEGDATSAPAAFTLGKGAGMRGFTVSHTANIWPMNDSGEIEMTPTSYAVRAAGFDTYVQDITFTNSYLGIDLTTNRSDNFLIKDLWATFLKEGIRIGGGTEGGYIEIATVDFGPWHGWRRLPKEVIRGVRSPYNQWIQDNLELLIFENCKNISVFSPAAFYPRRQVVFKNGVDDSVPKNIKLWISLFDVSRDEGIIALAGEKIDFYGVFITGGGSGVFNWLEVSDDFAGPLNVYGPTIQPTYFNRPFKISNENYNIYYGNSLTSNRPAKASSQPKNSNQAKHAVDGDSRTYWESSPQSENSLTIDLGDEYVLDRWRVIGHGLFGHSLKNLVTASLQVSQDGVNFLEADRVEMNASTILERPLPQVTKARHVKLKVEAGTNSLGFNRARIHEFDVYEAPLIK